MKNPTIQNKADIHNSRFRGGYQYRLDIREYFKGFGSIFPRDSSDGETFRREANAFSETLVKFWRAAF